MDAELIHGLVVRSGDTLILSYERRLTADEARRIKTVIKDRMPDLADVVIVTDVSAVAVYRPDQEASDAAS
jgi:hypothetical protein